MSDWSDGGRVSCSAGCHLDRKRPRRGTSRLYSKHAESVTLLLYAGSGLELGSQGIGVNAGQGSASDHLVLARGRRLRGASPSLRARTARYRYTQRTTSDRPGAATSWMDILRAREPARRDNDGTPRPGEPVVLMRLGCANHRPPCITYLRSCSQFQAATRHSTDFDLAVRLSHLTREPLPRNTTAMACGGTALSEIPRAIELIYYTDH